jgi:hypothetical protein
MSHHGSAKEITGDHVRVDEIKSSKPSNSGKSQPLFGTLRRYRWAITWCIYMLWCVLANNYAKTAGQSVLGIPQFRKDFGSAYNGGYVLSAKWQSAYYGAPQAA